MSALTHSTAVLNTELDAALEELGRLHSRHAQLQAKVKGIPDKEIPHVEAAASPKRKRTQYGEAGSSTRVLSDED